MRIISQDGKYDFPYEQTCFYINESNIIAFGANTPIEDSGYRLAEYSTLEKAEKAMNMLHDAYTGILFVKNVDLPTDFDKNFKKMYSRGYGIIATHDDGIKKAEFYPLNICFQFPKEDDLEVSE